MTDHEPLETALRAQLATIRVTDDPAATERMITAVTAREGRVPHQRRVPLAPLAAAAAVVVVAGGVTLLETGKQSSPSAAGSTTLRASGTASPASSTSAPPSATPTGSEVPGRPTTFTLHLDVPAGQARTVERSYAATGRQFTVLRIGVSDARRDTGILDVSGGNTFVLKSYRLQDVRNRDLPQTDLIHIVRGAPLQVSIECTSAPTGRCAADVRITGYAEARYPTTASPTEAPSGGVGRTTMVDPSSSNPPTSTAPTPSRTAPATGSESPSSSPTGSPTRTCSPTTTGPGC